MPFLIFSNIKDYQPYIDSLFILLHKGLAKKHLIEDSSKHNHDYSFLLLMGHHNQFGQHIILHGRYMQFKVQGLQKSRLQLIDLFTLKFHHNPVMRRNPRYLLVVVELIR